MRRMTVLFDIAIFLLIFGPILYKYLEHRAKLERISALGGNSVRIVAEDLFAMTDEMIKGYEKTAQAVNEDISDPSQSAWLVRWQQWLHKRPDVDLLSLDQSGVEAREEFAQLAKDIKTTFPDSKEWKRAGIAMLSALEKKPELLTPERIKEIQDFRESWSSQGNPK